MCCRCASNSLFKVHVPIVFGFTICNKEDKVVDWTRTYDVPKNMSSSDLDEPAKPSVKIPLPYTSHSQQSQYGGYLYQNDKKPTNQLKLNMNVYPSQWRIQGGSKGSMEPYFLSYRLSNKLNIVSLQLNNSYYLLT